MIAAHEMPEDNADLAAFEVSFPRLPDDSAESCPVPLDEVMEYLAMEVPDGEHLVASDLEFRRSAMVGERLYWIWSFQEPDGTDAYVTVSVGPDGATIGYDADFYRLTPEQFMLGDYHQVF